MKNDVAYFAETVLGIKLSKTHRMMFKAYEEIQRGKLVVLAPGVNAGRTFVKNMIRSHREWKKNFNKENK